MGQLNFIKYTKNPIKYIRIIKNEIKDFFLYQLRKNKINSS